MASDFSALLDIIDSKRKQLPSKAASSSSLLPSSLPTQATLPTIPPKYTKHFDEASQRYYYYNTETLTSQWDEPEDYSELVLDSLSHPINSLVESVPSVALFNSKSGAISSIGSQSYFEKQGRATDKEGRQLGVFFDMNTFEKNRAEAAEKKRKLQASGINWREYKEEKKKKRFRLKNSWLYEED